MSELFALKKPYHEHLWNDDGTPRASWAKVTELTKMSGLRPYLPTNLDFEIRSLIEECWSDEPGLRLAFPVLLERLANIARRQDTSGEGVNEAVQDDAKDLVRALHQCLWDSNTAGEIAGNVVKPTTCISSEDRVLNEIFQPDKGEDGIKALGNLIFSGVDEGMEVVPEPLLDEDIVISQGGHSALVKVCFALRPNAHRVRRLSTADKKELNSIKDSMLARLEGRSSAQGEQPQESESEGESSQGSPKGSASGGSSRSSKGSGRNLSYGKLGSEKRKKRFFTPKRKAVKKESGFMRRRRLRKEREARAAAGGNAPKGEDDQEKLVLDFIKAARFVRGRGAGDIHLSSKIQLYGLLSQAQKGDCPKALKDKAVRRGSFPLSRSSDEALNALKIQSWHATRGKTREEAMKAYVELVSALAPHYRLVGFTSGIESRSKKLAKVIMWVLRLDLGHDKDRNILVVEHVEILQSSTASSAKAWNEESYSFREVKNTIADGSASGGLGDAGGGDDGTNFDLLLADAPALSAADFLVDAENFPTMDAQRKHHSNQIKAMARDGHDDDDDDGWKFLSRAKGGEASASGIDVYRRSVKWSGAPQYRSETTVAAPVETIFEMIAFHKNEKVEKVLLEQSDSSTFAIAITYRTIKLPFPLTSRALFCVRDCVLHGKGTQDAYFTTCQHDLPHPHYRSIKGFATASTKWQGFYCSRFEEGDESLQRLVWLANLDFQGVTKVPSAIVTSSMIDLMLTPLLVAADAEVYSASKGFDQRGDREEDDRKKKGEESEESEAAKILWLENKVLQLEGKVSTLSTANDALQRKLEAKSKGETEETEEKEKEKGEGGEGEEKEG